MEELGLPAAAVATAASAPNSTGTGGAASAAAATVAWEAMDSSFSTTGILSPTGSEGASTAAPIVNPLYHKSTFTMLDRVEQQHVTGRDLICLELKTCLVCHPSTRS